MERPDVHAVLDESNNGNVAVTDVVIKRATRGAGCNDNSSNNKRSSILSIDCDGIKAIGFFGWNSVGVKMVIHHETTSALGTAGRTRFLPPRRLLGDEMTSLLCLY